MERFFLIIQRLNSILLLLVLVGAGLFIAWASWSSNQWQRRGAIEVPAGKTDQKDHVLLRFDRVENISGANTQMILLSARSESRKFSSGSGYGSETRNVLFLSGNEKKARWLFPKPNNLILTATQLHKEAKCAEDMPTLALYFEYVNKDSDGDGKLTNQDNSVIALAKPDGSGFVQVLDGVNRVLSYDMLDGQYLAVVYQVRKTVRYAKFSVVTLAKESDQEVTNVPDML